ncbi:replication protein A 70 kDa DNA-binding subunit B-like [Coffea eugenioides]|uniref:replication protein A 70 kDa DNA-binding subunit B-like n=1 Tax=Coffea eugenioides TaxID=49369 RepID=UPI000F608912|nr:replication protein A 70 kDa DNA-binding subunit B-like [Coffea eugenioides]
MEQNVVIFNRLNDVIYGWVLRVVLVEKSLIRDSRNMGRMYQRFVFADSLGDRVQAVAYYNDIHVLNETLQLYSTYYIADAAIRRILNGSIMLGSVPFELVLRPNTFIQTVDEGLTLPIHNVYHLTRFGDLESLRHSRDSIITILGVVIQVLPMQVFMLGGRYIRVQEFLLINEEMMPIVYAIWDDFIDTDGLYLAQIAHEYPIILVCRPKISYFHGLSLGT